MLGSMLPSAGTGTVRSSSVDVAFTASEAREADVTVVIDVLRATSTIVQALHSGYESVLCADGIDRARSLAGPGRILAGERNCSRPPGFDLGNSPSDMTTPLGGELVLATTNGAPAIVRAAELSPVVILAALLNLDAVCRELAGEELDPGEVQLLCSGTDGRPALEDIYVAGRIAARLPGSMSDAALASQAVAAAYPSARVALGASADAGALIELGLDSDVDWCARESVASVIPRVQSVHLEAGARHALVSASPANADIDPNLTVSHNI